MLDKAWLLAQLADFMKELAADVDIQGFNDSAKFRFSTSMNRKRLELANRIHKKGEEDEDRRVAECKVTVLFKNGGKVSTQTPLSKKSLEEMFKKGSDFIIFDTVDPAPEVASEVLGFRRDDVILYSITEIEKNPIVITSMDEKAATAQIAGTIGGGGVKI